jgi:lipopolysaccharide export system protein LptA
MPKSRFLLLIATGVALSVWFTSCFALKSDKEKPIEVSANSAERDERIGITTYTGNVEIKQGTLLIQADQVVIKTIISKKNSVEELHEIITSGQPSHFQQQLKVDGDLVDATANTILYRVADKKVDLIDNAILKQQGRIITGDKISYDVSAQRVTATSHAETAANTGEQATSEKTPGRVTVVIPAKPKDKNTTDSKP